MARTIARSKIEIEVKDWSRAKDSPGYDVNIKINGEYVTGAEAIFGTAYDAQLFIRKLVRKIISMSKGEFVGKTWR